MKRMLSVILVTVILLTAACRAGTENERQSLTNTMSDVERNSAVIGECSPEQKYYDEVEHVAEFIQEMKIYDEELDSTYIIHITLPPDYDENKSYPMYMMTDGIWRLSDHAELRPLMVNGEIENIILVSIGYDYGIDAEDPVTREVEFVRKNNLFLDFITDNLAPYMGELYNIDYSRSTLMGQSLGGLFLHYAVFNSDKYENQPFHNYVMVSPVFWYLQIYGSVNEAYSEYDYFERNTAFDKEVFLTAGDSEETEEELREYEKYGIDSMLQGIEKLMKRMEKHGVTTIDVKIYEGADHVSFTKQMMKESLIKFYAADKNTGTPDGGNITPVLAEKNTVGAGGEIDYFSLKAGDIINFGGYNWRVLDVKDGKALILSDKILTQTQYHSISGLDVTWENCDLRKYLNGTFYDIVFSAEEKERIAESKTVNNANPWYGTPGCNETADKIFLLSVEEAALYFGDSGQLRSRPSAAVSIDDEYNSMRAAEEALSWWLRSSGGISYNAAYVRGGGEINIYGSGVSTNYGVRPALWIIL